MTEDEMVGWHHWLNGHEFEQALGDSEGQGGLACCSPWGGKELGTTERLNWTYSGRGFPVGSDSKECLQCQRPGFNPWVGKIPWRGEWLPTPIFLPGEFHGQRRLVGYGSWTHKEPDTTKHLTLSLCLLRNIVGLKRIQPLNISPFFNIDV